MQNLSRRSALLAGVVGLALGGTYMPRQAEGGPINQTLEPIKLLDGNIVWWGLPNFDRLDPANFTFRIPSFRLMLGREDFHLQQVSYGDPVHTRHLKQNIYYAEALTQMDSGPVFCIDTQNWRACRWSAMRPAHQYIHMMLDNNHCLQAVDLFTLVRLDYTRKGTSGEPVAEVYEPSEGYKFCRLWDNPNLVPHGEGTTAGS